ncbi:peptidylprolyl isomerase [Patescibacteria group bacterium]|nr:peptidylprolyl isomerase [Patescibacteria group bacterium]MBU1705804.1 peptidylprolyl isomerase [Patescibacteria group bacterium]
MELPEQQPYNSAYSAPMAPVEFEPTKPEKVKSKKIRFLLGFLLGAIVVAGGLTWYVYQRPINDPVMRSVVNVLPYPALVINGERVSIKEFLLEYDALSNFYQAQPEAPSEDELKVTVADTLVNKTILEQLSAKYGVSADDEQINLMMSEVAAAPGGEEAFAQQLADNFGWTMDDFRERVAKSLVLANQMTEFVGNNVDLQQNRRTGIDQAQTRLAAGEDFAIVAGDLSEDPSAKAGGDIGFVPLSEMVDPWLSAVVDLEVGEVSEIIESQENYMIFQVTDRIIKEEDEEIQMSVIVVNKVTLDEVVEEFLNNSEITRYLGKM